MMLSTTVLDMMKIMLPILCMVFGLFALAALMQRRYHNFVLWTILGGIAGVVPMLLFPSSGSTSKKPATAANVSTPAHPDPTRSNPSVAETVTTSPAPSSSNGTEHMPWELFGFIFVSLIVLGLVIFGMVLISSHLKKKSNIKSENISAWKDLIYRHNAVRAQWASYEMDMSKLIDMPVMTDMREPVVIALHKALKTASSLAPKTLAKFAYTPIQDSAFFAAVNDLEIAFNSAEQTAKKVAWSKFTKEERRSLSTAKQLLSLAMDSGASPAERQSAYKRVFKELQGLIAFPEKARLELESRHQLSLAA